MTIEHIKKQYHRFKQWQKKPYEFKLISDKVNHCNNCGNDFTGNYCPICSQKAGDGPIGWASVWQSFMDIWGLGTHSLPKTVGHLLLRPGYLISDYISGKRQVSFPPVKMLFFVAIFVVLLDYYLMPFLFGSDFDMYGGTTEAYKGFSEWNQSHFAWTYFILAILFILPTWIMFRNGPKLTHHTLPQGFFIQVFLFVLNLVISFILLLPLMLLNFTAYSYISIVVLLIYFVIVYKQLFGYGIWGTLWRIVIVWVSVYFVLEALLYLIFEVDFNLDPNNFSPDNSRFFYSGNLTAKGLIALGIGWLINLVTTKLIHRGLQNRQTNESAKS